MVKRPDGVGREKVRAELGLAVWEVELAAETGLLRRLPDRSFDPASVKAAQDDLEAFGRRLARERRCNATESAARLGVSVERFKRVAAAAGLMPVAEEDVHRYGRVLHVLYYRAGDVDAVADHVRADVELRAAATTVSREHAGRKAAATRRRNAQLARVARAELEQRKPPADAGAIDVLVWAVALMRTAEIFPGPLRKFAHVDDGQAQQLARLIREARFGRGELQVWLDDILPRAARAAEGLATPDRIAATLGVSARLVSEHVQHFGLHIPVPVLRELAEAPPSWLLTARAEIELHLAATEVMHQDERRREAALEAAGRATARLSDASVAELLGLSEEVVRRLRVGKGQWKTAYVKQLLDRRPAWSLTEEAAWAEATRRQEKREARKRKHKRG